MVATVPEAVRNRQGYEVRVGAVCSVRPNGQLADPSGTRRYVKGVRLAVAAASVKTGALAAGEYLLHASVKCYVIAEAAATAAAVAATCIPLEAGEKFHLEVAEGDAVAVVQDSVGGFLHVVPAL